MALFSCIFGVKFWFLFEIENRSLQFRVIMTVNNTGNPELIAKKHSLLLITITTHTLYTIYFTLNLFYTHCNGRGMINNLFIRVITSSKYNIDRKFSEYTSTQRLNESNFTD